MSTLQDALLKWADELNQYKTPGWDSYPDIDLYMDQVITWLERQMTIFSQQDKEKLITPAMINNYVKNQVIPRPVEKKYTRVHLAHLISVLNLKQVLSLSDITKLISQVTSNEQIKTLFDQFAAIQDEAFQHTSVRVRESLEKLDGDLNEEEAEKRLSILALKLSLEANSYSIAAKTIIEKISESKEKLKDKGKDKAKKSEEKL